MSIISIAPGTTPPETIAETASPAALVVSKNATIVLTASGTGTTRSVIFVQIAERALRADERAEQVVAGRVDLLAAERDDLAVGEHDLQAGDVVRREAVLEAVRAAGVLGDVAADRADDLRRRVGRVEVRRRRRRALTSVFVTPGSTTMRPLSRSTSSTRAHARDGDQHALLRPAARRPTGPSRRRARPTARRRPSTRARRRAPRAALPGRTTAPGVDAVLQQPVGLVRAQLDALGEDVLGAADRAQALEQRSARAGAGAAVGMFGELGHGGGWRRVRD